MSAALRTVYRIAERLPSPTILRMPFPQSVADQVLVACGRHCALCHKYCGLKIELHHIKHRSAGGPDTFENCIPLCFDCHADMRSYDYKHPKGRKFSEAELVKRRDLWYERLQSSGGPIAAPVHREQDQAMYSRLTEILPIKGVISYIRERAGGVFVRSRLDPLHEYLNECRDPSFEFLDVDLEGLRAKLTEAIAQYVEHVLNHTFAFDRPDVLYVQPEMKHRDPDAYYEILETLTKDEHVVLTTYDALVRMARRKLSV